MAKRKKKLRIPKRIGGVKIPKSVRKGDLGAFLNSNTGQAMLGQAALLITAAFAGRQTTEDSAVRQTLKHPRRKLGQAGALASAAGDAMPEASDRLKHAFAEAMRAFRDALEAHGQSAPWPEPRAFEGSKKKSASNEDEPDLRH